MSVLEEDPFYVGGISKTVVAEGFHFDIGGHRFFSKSKAVEDFWSEILPDDLIVRPRSSRIYYGGKFYQYPLKPLEALRNLGLLESMRCVLSYLWYRIFPYRSPSSFDRWVSNQFGQRLFRIFFKTYTEKVWGMPCAEISADWAAQRIKNLSLGSAILHGFLGKTRWSTSSKKRVITSLIETFRYPRRGPGMLWEACRDRVLAQGGSLLLNARVNTGAFDSEKRIWRLTYTGNNGEERSIEGTHVISSAALGDIIPHLQPTPSVRCIEAASSLRYRDFLTVALVTEGPELFPENWIYIHDPQVQVGRIQNYKSWSPEMVPELRYGCYGLEYFCFTDDVLWSANDATLIELAMSELKSIGLGHQVQIVRGFVVRQRKAYPVYDDSYAQHVQTIRKELRSHYPNFYAVGRNGMHRYNNQDHAVMTAMLTVDNILGEREDLDVWQVNEDAEYLEVQNGSSTSERWVPRKIRSDEERPAAISKGA